MIFDHTVVFHGASLIALKIGNVVKYSKRFPHHIKVKGGFTVAAAALVEM